MGQRSARSLAPGTCIAGRYEVVRRLGAGTLGVVYECNHRELAGYTVAMKVLFDELVEDSHRIDEFRKKVVASYEVNSPHVVRTYEYFRDAGMVAYTMEYIPGSNLSEFTAASEDISIVEALTILVQMCAGLREIHKNGIVHMNLKPENILLTEEGQVKVSDFGVVSEKSGLKPLDQGGMVGSVDYVSPEFLEGKGYDSRSDIYAVGIIGYELISGQLPFSGRSPLDALTKRLRVAAEPLESAVEGCPSRLSEIISTALERNPDERYQDAAELGAALQDVLEALHAERGTQQTSPVDVDELVESFGDEGLYPDGVSVLVDEDIGSGSEISVEEHVSEQHRPEPRAAASIAARAVLEEGGSGYSSQQSLIAVRAKQHRKEVEARKDIFRGLVAAFFCLITILVAVLMLILFKDTITESFSAAAGAILEEILRALRQ